VTVAERGLRFIRSMDKDLSKKEFSQRFIWSWTFGAYLSLARLCKPFKKSPESPAVGKWQARDFFLFHRFALFIARSQGRSKIDLFF
jgi:hypothetical protein